MSEMVERVARILQNADDAFDSVEAIDPTYIALASAAIAAMREPTEAMKDAGFLACDDTRAWKVMIDAALQDAPRERTGDYYSDPDVGPPVGRQTP